MVRTGLVTVVVVVAALGGAASSAGAQVGGGDGGGDGRGLAPVRATGSATAVPGRYIVVLAPRTSVRARTTAERQAGQSGGEVTARYGAALQGFAARLPAAAVTALRRNPDVAFLEADQQVTVESTERDAPWGLDRVDQRKHRLNHKYVYDGNGAGVTAYVVDTGIRATHHQFRGRVTPGFTAVKDGRGTNDCYGHGTHVAGTIGSKTYGVAKKVTLTPVRVLNCNGRGTTSQILAGIDWVTAHHHGNDPAVANMSIGGPASDAEDLAITNSVVDGVTYAVAAGNESHNACQGSPARSGPAITVGATTRTDRRSFFSNYGSCVDIFAPGSGIASTWNTSDRATMRLSGTSMATPHVTGAAALYLQRYPDAAPAAVTDALLGASTTGALTHLHSGSPDRLLYSRVGTSPSAGTPFVNADFESREHGWTSSRYVITDGGDIPARSGSWKAWFDGYGTDHTDVLAQRIEVPAQPTVTLSFYLRVRTEETGGSAFDKLAVKVLADDGSQTLDTFSNRDASPEYVLRSIDLTAYAGQTVTVELVGSEDGTHKTDFVVDDLAID